MNRMRLQQLEADAAPMVSRSHVSFLSTVQNALRRPPVGEEPTVAALRLLCSLWGSHHADRPEPKTALNEVGSWLESRLQREPAVGLQALKEEMGWLKRLAVIQGAKGGRNTRIDEGQCRERRFGRHIDRIARLRVASAELGDPGQPISDGRGAPAALSAAAEGALTEFLAFFGDGSRFLTERMGEKDALQRPLAERLAQLREAHPAACARAAERVLEVLNNRKKRSRRITELLKDFNA